jgi:hypothetical protein
MSPLLFENEKGKYNLTCLDVLESDAFPQVENGANIFQKGPLKDVSIMCGSD